MVELVVNIWIFIDIETDLAYNWAGRVYNIDGNDEQKATVLKKLSSTDFYVCKRHAFPENVKAVIGDKELKGYVPADQVRTFFGQYPDLFFNELERALPPILEMGSLTSRPQKIPNNPYYVITQVYEDEKGKLHPILTSEDVQWLENQRRSRGYWI